MENIFSVSALTEAIKKQLEFCFSTIQVKGEVSNLKEQSSGHYYFTLKDQESQIPAVLFRGHARDLSRPLKDGGQVVIRGEISVYAPRGYYQLIVRKLDYLGVGELLLQLHALKAKLEKQGWFETSRKKALPKFPKTIGVVTSPTGSVIQDILHVLNRRFSGFHLILNPVKVQGQGAAEEIAKAIEMFNHHKLADVLIVGRGGGSLEDLWAFNEEKVASAIYHSKIPIISAVGHETDYSIADFVADVRAPTPSAAAEIATLVASEQLLTLKRSKERLQATLLTLLKHHHKHLEQLKRHPFLSHPFLLIEPHAQRLDSFRSDFDLSIKNYLQEKELFLSSLKKQMHTLKPHTQLLLLKQKLHSLSQSLTGNLRQQILNWKKSCDPLAWHKPLDQTISFQVKQKEERLMQLAAHLHAINPKNLLTKGYCILFHENTSSVILSSSELKEKKRVCLQLQDGKALLTVNEIKSP